MQLWDLVGSDRIGGIAGVFFKRSVGAIMATDIKYRDLETLKKVITNLTQKAHHRKFATPADCVVCVCVLTVLFNAFLCSTLNNAVLRKYFNVTCIVLKRLVK